MTFSKQEVTQLLVAWSQGDQAAFERLMPLVYEELRREFVERFVEIGVDAAGKITPKVEVAEIATLLGPVRKTVALQQPGERAADRQPVISHGGEYENLVEVERRRQDVGDLEQRGDLTELALRLAL